MEDKNAINLQLRYQCRHDARRRFMRPNSCQKAPLRDFDGVIKTECLACAGPLDVTKTKEAPAMPEEKNTEAYAQEILDCLGLDVDEPPARVDLKLPQKQWCGCGRDYAEPYENGPPGKCKLCKKEHAKAAMRQKTLKQVKNEETARPRQGVEAPAPGVNEPAPLCRKCGTQPAGLRKNGQSLGICPDCNKIKMANMQAARRKAADTAEPASLVKVKKPKAIIPPPVTANTPPSGINFAAPAVVPLDGLLHTLLADMHEFWQVYRGNHSLIDPKLAQILVTGELLYNFSNERQAK